MYVVDGIAYTGEATAELAVKNVKVLDDMYVIVEFSTGEKRILDATVLLEYPIFKKLHDPEVFATASVEDGVLVWMDGEIDIGTTTLYNKSIPYDAEKLA